jgi:hypothetical protein
VALEGSAFAATRTPLIEREVDGYASRVRARVAHTSHARPPARHAQQRLLDEVLRGRGVSDDQIDRSQKRLASLFYKAIELVVRAAHYQYNLASQQKG